jgi:hypothetical protein
VRAYSVYPAGDSWQVVVAARSAQHAKRLAWKVWPPVDSEWTDLRVRWRREAVLPEGEPAAAYESCDHCPEWAWPLWNCEYCREETGGCDSPLDSGRGVTV